MPTVATLIKSNKYKKYATTTVAYKKAKSLLERNLLYESLFRLLNSILDDYTTKILDGVMFDTVTTHLI